MMDTNLLQEIEEDLQRQRYEALWKRYGLYITGAVLVILLATAAFTSWRSWHTQASYNASSGLLRIMEGNVSDKMKQVSALEDFARAHQGANQAALARLHAAAIALKEGKTDKALVLYDALATDKSVEPVFRQLADLYAVQAQVDTGDPAALQARLVPLLTDSPWRFSAKEYSAHLALKAGDKAKAKKLLQELTQETEAPSALTQRAQDMLRWLNEGQ